MNVYLNLKITSMPVPSAKKKRAFFIYPMIEISENMG